MAINLNQLVDDILGEPEARILYTIPGDIASFPESMSRVRSHASSRPCSAVFCESIESMIPESTLRSLSDHITVIPTRNIRGGKIPPNIEAVMIPHLTENVISRLISEDAPGVLPEVWREARRQGIPLLTHEEALQHLKPEDAARARSILQSKTSTLAKPKLPPGSRTTPESPELELIADLVTHLCGNCETEDGQPCSDCGMCRVRGF